MLNLILIGLLPFSFGTTFVDGYKERFESEVRSIGKLSDVEIRGIMRFIETDSQVEYRHLVQLTSEGAFLEGKHVTARPEDPAFSIKLLLDKIDFPKCKTEVENYNLVVSGHRDNEIVRQMLQSDTHHLRLSNYDLYFCILRFEHGVTTLMPLLRDPENFGDDDGNSGSLYEFIKEILHLFSVFNFEYGFFHGKVKQDSLVTVYKPGRKPGFRIDEFGSVFRAPFLKARDSGHDYFASGNENVVKECNPSFLTYDLSFRPPELKTIVPTADWTPGQKPRQMEKYEEHKWTELYKEDAFAVGITIRKIVNENKGKCNQKNKRFALLDNVILNLTKDNPTDRWSVKQALEYLVKGGTSLRILRSI